MNYNAIIKSAVITEKSSKLVETEGKYVFEVGRLSTKGQIKKAIEDLYTVKVVDVHVLATRPKEKRSFANRKRTTYLTKDVKKAIVKLSPDSKLSLFDDEKKK